MSAQAAPALGKYGPIEVFRTGSFVDMSGTRQDVGEGTLREIADGYDRDLAPAPVVIGHPETHTPAFGWVESLYVEGGILKATLGDTAAEFADMVKAGRYKRVSISMFLPKSPANPKPERFYLKHVGFLGAMAPAVPGLKPVKFAGGPGDTLALVQDNADAASFAGGDELTRLRRQAREFEVERLIGEGRVLPVFKDEVVAFAASLDDSQTVSFAEGGEAVTRKGWFMSYLARQPKVVSFGAFDMGNDRPTAPLAARAPAHNAPQGYQVDRRNDDLFFTAQAVAKEKGISFADAVDLVIEGRV